MSFNIPSFPDVPFAAGVPSVLRNPKNIINNAINNAKNIAIGAAQQQINGLISNVQEADNGDVGYLSPDFGEPPEPLTQDAPAVINVSVAAQGQWGIFDQENNLVLEPDSFKSLSFQQGWRIANYPMERGAFQTYNKVETPFETGVVCTKGGTDSDRSDFLSVLSEIADSIELFNIVTPEVVYTNVSIEHYDYQRTAINGAKLITFDIKFIEVRIVESATFTNTATPSGTDTVNSGTVQSIQVTTTTNVNSQGAPTSEAESASGFVPPQASEAPTSLVPSTSAAAITNSQTPAVAGTLPAFDSLPRDAEGNQVGVISKDPMTGKTETLDGYYAVNQETGFTEQFDYNGNLIQSSSPANQRIQ